MKKHLSIFMLALAISTMPVSYAFAQEDAQTVVDEVTNEASKRIQVDLADSYAKVQFDITCDDEKASEYSFFIESPNGTKTDVTPGDNGRISEVIENAAKGSWYVNVCDNGVLNGGNIGAVNVSVKKITEGSTDNTKEDGVSVKKELSGLQIYLKDDALVAQWTDESAGNVNVRVFDTESQEVFANTTVSEKEIEVPIPSSTKNVTISLTPSTSQNVEGEEQQYTIVNENNPDASVTFPDYTDTNQMTMEYTVTLGKAYGVECYLNGALASSEENLEAGEHTLSVNLQEGANDVKVYIVDEKGNKRSFSKNVSLDTKAPVLMIETNYDGLQTYDDAITFTGKVEDYDSITFNNKTDIEVNYDGTFTVSSDLTEGENKFLISATDKAGNEAQYTAVVTRVVRENGGLDAETVGLLVILALVIIGIIIYVIRKKRQSYEYVYVDENGNEVELTSDMVVEEEALEGSTESNFQKLFQKLKSRKGKEQTDKEKPKEKHKDKKSKKKIKGDSEKNPGAAQSREEEAESSKQKKTKKVHRKAPVSGTQIVKLILFFVIPIAVVLGVVHLTLSFGEVSSSSMEPNIMTGDFTVASKISYLVKEPQRGDIVFISGHAGTVGTSNAAESPDETSIEDTSTSKTYLKRIIGMPGDQISFKDGYVYINGERCIEKYLSDDVETNCTEEFTVPDGCYFVLGDNRENSIDSRFWSDPYVKKSELVKVLFYFTI